MVCATFVLAALLSSDLEVGARVRVATRGEEMTGLVEAIENASLRVRLEDGSRTRSIPFSDVMSLEVSRGRRSRTSGAWSKARWGALIGATTGAVSLGLQHEQVGEGGSSPGKAVALGAWSGGLFGGLLGAAIGAMAPGEAWERVTPSFQLGKDGADAGFALSVTIAF